MSRCRQLFVFLFCNRLIKVFVALLFLWAYIVLGGYLFKALEEELELSYKERIHGKRQNQVNHLVRKVSKEMFNRTDNNLMIYLDPERSYLVHQMMVCSNFYYYFL